MVTFAGGLILNSELLGQHEYVVYDGPITLDAGNPFDVADWFSDVEDERSSWCIVKGNLTIDAGQIFRPSVRKLFTVLYVDGDLAVDGEISMTARGADHSSATGANVPAVALLIAIGSYSGVTDPEVPAAGGAGAVAESSGSSGASGAAGTDGATGGGGAGERASGTPGSGAAGTSFSGGPGGGGSSGGSGSGGDGAASGGPGGAGNNAGNTDRNAGGGAGNPGGAKIGPSGSTEPGDDGTGGVLIVICTGALSGTGTISANGADGGDAAGTVPSGGGASGGGSVTVLYGTDTSSITPTATGGVGGDGSNVNGGGEGGDGTARKLALA